MKDGDPNSSVQRKDEPARKFDGGKPPVDLVPAQLVLGVAEVLRHGAEKYDAHNWRGGMSWSRVYAAVQRHLLAWNEGENRDQDSGLPHLAHAACGLAFLLNYVETKPGLDDRFKEGPCTQ